MSSGTIGEFVADRGGQVATIEFYYEGAWVVCVEDEDGWWFPLFYYEYEDMALKPKPPRDEPVLTREEPAQPPVNPTLFHWLPDLLTGLAVVGMAITLALIGFALLVGILLLLG